MITRHIVGSPNQDYSLTYDAENRLVSVSGSASATFTYDADGSRVETVVNGATTFYIGNYYEIAITAFGAIPTKYYYTGGQRVAMRQNGVLSYLFSDNLGSTTVTADTSGTNTGELRYSAWGGTRYSSGTTQTSYHYTGQIEDNIGLYYYNARYYDNYITQFTQPDPIIPDPYNPLDWNRYSYVRYNPIHWA